MDPYDPNDPSGDGPYHPPNMTNAGDVFWVDCSHDDSNFTLDLLKTHNTPNPIARGDNITFEMAG